MATVKDALNLTTRTIDRRAFHFRNLIVSVVLVWVACLVWAGITWSAQPLLGWLTLMPLCGGFLFLDICVVNRWRDEILRMWTDGNVPLDVFAASIAGIRILPPGTLRSMLATLPTSVHGSAADRFPPAMKKAIAGTLTTIHRCDGDRAFFATLAYTVALASLAWAAVVGEWWPTLGLLVAAAIWPLFRPVGSWRLRSWQGQMRRCQTDGLDLAALVEFVRPMDWGSISSVRREKLLNALLPAEI